MPWDSGGGGAVPISHNALQHFPECHGAVGGVPCQVQLGGGTLPGPAGGRYPGRGGGYPGQGGYPGKVRMGGGTLPGEGGTQVGQQKEYSLHGGRYASCVHAGGLSCSIWTKLGAKLRKKSKYSF